MEITRAAQISNNFLPVQGLFYIRDSQLQTMLCQVQD